MIRAFAHLLATPLVTALIGAAEAIAELVLLYFVGTSVEALVGFG